MRAPIAALLALAYISISQCRVSLEHLAVLANEGSLYDCTDNSGIDLTEVPQIIHQVSLMMAILVQAKGRRKHVLDGAEAMPTPSSSQCTCSDTLCCAVLEGLASP